MAATRSPYIPISFSGEEGLIYNGVPDWLYSGKTWFRNAKYVTAILIGCIQVKHDLELQRYATAFLIGYIQVKHDLEMKDM